MPARTRVLRLQWGFNMDNSAPVLVTTGNVMTSPRFVEVLPEVMKVTGESYSGKYPPLVLANSLAQGSGPVFTVESGPDCLAEGSDLRKLEVLHAEMLSKNGFLIMAMGGDTEVAFIPLSKPQGTQVVCFVAYTLIRGSLEIGKKLLDDSRLPLVMDLDETLVQAVTAGSLATRIKLISDEINRKDLEMIKCTSDAERSELCSTISLLTAEKSELENDLVMLKAFEDSNDVTFDGELHESKMETVIGSTGGTFLRPTIRLTPNRVITRIVPGEKKTSMIINIRPGWERLSEFLIGEEKLRFQVYICTTAEREYAFECWRLLDPDNKLIPASELASRIFCVKNPNVEKKSLFRTIGLGPKCVAPVSNIAHNPHENFRPIAEHCCEMPMAMIVDDRTDVWDKRAKDHIVQPAPYNAYRNRVDYHDPDELEKVRSVLTHARSFFYMNLDTVVTPFLKDRRQTGQLCLSEMGEIKRKMARLESIVPFLKEGTQRATKNRIGSKPSVAVSEDAEMTDVQNVENAENAENVEEPTPAPVVAPQPETPNPSPTCSDMILDSDYTDGNTNYGVQPGQPLDIIADIPLHPPSVVAPGTGISEAGPLAVQLNAGASPNEVRVSMTVENVDVGTSGQMGNVARVDAGKSVEKDQIGVNGEGGDAPVAFQSPQTFVSGQRDGIPGQSLHAGESAAGVGTEVGPPMPSGAGVGTSQMPSSMRNVFSKINRLLDDQCKGKSMVEAMDMVLAELEADAAKCSSQVMKENYAELCNRLRKRRQGLVENGTEKGARQGPGHAQNTTETVKSHQQNGSTVEPEVMRNAQQAECPHDSQGVRYISKIAGPDAEYEPPVDVQMGDQIVTVVRVKGKVKRPN